LRNNKVVNSRIFLQRRGGRRRGRGRGIREVGRFIHSWFIK